MSGTVGTDTAAHCIAMCPCVAMCTDCGTATDTSLSTPLVGDCGPQINVCTRASSPTTHRSTTTQPVTVPTYKAAVARVELYMYFEL